MRSRFLVAALMLCACGAAAQPQRGSEAGREAGAPVVSKDASGHVTLRAVRLAGALRVDGRLDEAVYRDVPSIADFIQAEPLSGPPASQKTEAWVLFDDEAIYVTFRCWESNPERMIADEMRRDSFNIANQDSVAVGFDTFHDRRNSVVFNVTPLGAFMDGQVTDERSYNGD